MFYVTACLDYVICKHCNGIPFTIESFLGSEPFCVKGIKKKKACFQSWG